MYALVHCYIFIIVTLKRETLSTSASPLGIGIIKHKPFAVKSPGIFQYGTDQIKKTFFIHYDTHCVILKNFIGFSGLFIKIKLIGQSTATAALNPYPHVIPAGIKASFGH